MMPLSLLHGKEKVHPHGAFPLGGSWPTAGGPTRSLPLGGVIGSGIGVSIALLGMMALGCHTTPKKPDLSRGSPSPHTDGLPTDEGPPPPATEGEERSPSPTPSADHVEATAKELKRLALDLETAPPARAPEKRRALHRFINGLDTSLRRAMTSRFPLSASAPGSAAPEPAATLAVAEALVTLHETSPHTGSDPTVEVRRVLALLGNHPLAARLRVAVDRFAARLQPDMARIGILLPGSAGEDATAQGILAAAETAVDLLWEGADATVPRRGIELARLSVGADAPAAVQGLDRLIHEQRVCGVVGPSRQGQAEAVAAAAEGYAVPVIVPARNARLPTPRAAAFRIGLSEADQARALARHAFADGIRAFGIMAPRHPYGERSLRAFWAEVEALGGRVEAVEQYPEGTTDLRTFAASLTGRADPERRPDFAARVRQALDERKPANPIARRRIIDRIRDSLPAVVRFDALIIFDEARILQRLLPILQVEELAVNNGIRADVEILLSRAKNLRVPIRPVRLYGSNGWNSPDLLRMSQVARVVEGSVFTYGFHPEGGIAARFARAFAAKTGRAPSVPEVEVFDATRILAQACLSAPHRAGAIATLAALRGHTGAAGVYTTRSDGHLDRPPVWMTVREGRIVPLTATLKAQQDADRAHALTGKRATAAPTSPPPAAPPSSAPAPKAPGGR